MDNGTLVGNKRIEDSQPCYIIAEMSANHAGDINRAIEIVHAAKGAGADCIKIQTYTPDTITIDCDNKYFRIDNGTWEGETLYSLYGKAYTPWEWQPILKKEADRIGIDFLSTPFDKTSVDFLENMGIGFYKIASFEIVDIPLIKYVASKAKPMIISTGMASLEEIEEAVAAAQISGCRDICLLKCSSAYPAVPENMNLATIAEMKNRFGLAVGLSDHSLGSVAAITAVALGAKIIEKHFCISRDIENPDSSFSMDKEEFAIMVKEIREAERAIGTISYDISQEEAESKIFRKSIFVVKDMKEGERFSERNIRVIRPGWGMKPKYYENIIGKCSKVNVKRGEPLRPDMVMEE
ncbi:pseudaminic acid synthase [Ruminiclostridium sufflavum DSM 19573]|uniref:Pseudaminic acid synthase n=1 Tax=Ruminiclostridium sufflavum DSM 19573 TaxID=1121337 RepID=A0A318XMN3_9FIRM|nr:pseudaminic acid synthase [Ruminiclostridium sufflavum]PYG89122.1 pseudaminic acid synthase [Ruminiclostridium sufflavum DSM 19573]